MNSCKVYSDGGSRGNPGLSAIGVVLVRGDEVVKSFGEFLGVGTNNQAEYKALIKGLELANKSGFEELVCYSDSEIMIKQLRGEYKVHDKKLLELFVIVKKNESLFKSVDYVHVNRTDNFIKLADSLVNKALDEQGLK